MFDPETQATILLKPTDELRVLWNKIADDLTISDANAGPCLDFINEELARRGEEIEGT